MFTAILWAAIFIQTKNIVLPHTNVEDVRLAKDYSGVCLKIDGEYALYKKIWKKVFVRKTCDDSLIILPDTSKKITSFRFDLNGDGKIETVSFKKGILTIARTGNKPERYSDIKSFVFYDVDNNGSLDLIYVDTDNILHVLLNKYRVQNYALIYSPRHFTVNYISRKRTYPVTVYPYLVEGKIPLYGWDKVYLVYQGSKMPLKSGKTINLYNVENPVRFIVYENDTLKLGITLSEKQNYIIEINGQDSKRKIAEGILPQGVYRFEYFVGPLKRGKHRLVITLGKRTFTREISVK